MYVTPHSTPTPKRRWVPRFSLKALLISVTILGAFFAYFGHVLHRVTIQRRIVAQINEAGGTTRYNWRAPWVEHDYDRLTLTGTPSRRDPPGPAVLRWMLGDDAFAYVETVFFSDSLPHCAIDPRLLSELPRLKQVIFWRSRVSDESLASISAYSELRRLGLHGYDQGTATQAGLAQLQRTRKLEELELAGDWLTDETMLGVAQLGQLRRLKITKAPNLSSATIASVGQLTELRELSFLYVKGIDDDGLEAISRLPHLQDLSFAGPSVTDAGLPAIGRMTQLKYLRLWTPGVTDAGLPHLRSLVNLKELDLCYFHSTKGAADELRKALPNCSVRRRDESGRLVPD